MEQTVLTEQTVPEALAVLPDPLQWTETEVSKVRLAAMARVASKARRVLLALLVTLD